MASTSSPARLTAEMSLSRRTMLSPEAQMPVLSAWAAMNPSTTMLSARAVMPGTVVVLCPE
jgi:hypothetical protein